MGISFEQVKTFFHIYIQMLFLLGPFASASVFLMMSEGLDPVSRRKAAWRTSTAILVSICFFFFFGKPLFSVLGVTLHAFQIGTGSVLFLSSIMRILGIGPSVSKQADPEHDVAIVPVAIPLIVGPGTIGALLVYGTSVHGFIELLGTFSAVLAGGITVAIFVLLA